MQRQEISELCGICKFPKHRRVTEGTGQRPRLVLQRGAAGGPARKGHGWELPGGSRVPSKTEQGRAKRSKARQGKENEAKQSKVKRSKAKQGKAKQCKAKQCKVKQSKARRSKARQGNANQSRARQGKAKRGEAKRSASPRGRRAASPGVPISGGSPRSSSRGLCRVPPSPEASRGKAAEVRALGEAGAVICPQSSQPVTSSPGGPVPREGDVKAGWLRLKQKLLGSRTVSGPSRPPRCRCPHAAPGPVAAVAPAGAAGSGLRSEHGAERRGTGLNSPPVGPGAAGSESLGRGKGEGKGEGKNRRGGEGGGEGERKRNRGRRT